MNGVGEVAKARKKFSCDFETTTKLDDCRVWAYGYMELYNQKNFKIGNSLDEFMIWVKKSQADLYFHNLRFDGEFIVNWLLKNGFKWTKQEDAQPNTFSTTISGMGQWYVIDICYGYKGKNKIHTVIYDSLKKLPFPVKKIAKDFKLTILKGDIDYHTERPIGHIITEEEHAYIKNDIQIICEALEIQFNQGLDKMTNGSDSLAGFKNTISKKNFDRLFPVFSIPMDKELRYAYRGGFTWMNERYLGKVVHAGLVFDVNSLYPSVMYDKPLPYGTPLRFYGKYEKDEQYPLFIQHIRCGFELKEGFIPTIQVKKQRLWFKGNEYLKNSKGRDDVDLYLTNMDLELLFKHYDVYEIEYVAGWKFKQATGLFKDFIDKWTYIKMTSEGAVRALAKLMLNSLYGKFASNPDVTGKVPYLKEDGSCGFRVGDEDFKDPIYTPMGVFITSWARHITISTAQLCYDRIIYCDTDSIHLEGTDIPNAIADKIDDKALGKWAHETTFKNGKYLRQKTYMYTECMIEKRNEDGTIQFNEDGKPKYKPCIPKEATKTKLTVKCAGMPDSVKEFVTFENFKIGFTHKGKLLPKHVNGGVVLIDTDFTIK